MDGKKSRELLWPLGGTLLALLVVPVAIEQYPEIFKESPWILPTSIGVVATCWIFPLLLHENAKRIWRWSSSKIGTRLTVVIIVLILLTSGFGLKRLYLIHTKHLENRLAKEKNKNTPTQPIEHSSGTPPRETESKKEAVVPPKEKVASQPSQSSPSQPQRPSGLRPPHFEITEKSVTRVPYTPALYRLNFLLTNAGESGAQNLEGKILITNLSGYGLKVLLISSPNEIFANKSISFASAGFYLTDFAADQYFSIKICYRDSSNPKEYIPAQIFSYIWSGNGTPENAPSSTFRTPTSDEIKNYNSVNLPDPLMQQQSAFCTQAPEPR